MTVEQWKKRFKVWQNEHDVVWNLNMDNTSIRSKFGYMCPLTAEDGLSCGQIGKVSKSLDMSRRTRLAIMFAADEAPKHNARLRRWLLKTCGIEEAKT